MQDTTQYADDRNLRARQRLWHQQEPRFDSVRWVLDLADIRAGATVLDVGCGNGLYLDALRQRDIAALGLDLSFGMLHIAPSVRALVNADVTALPFADRSLVVVLAPHMLYHVPDRGRALREIRRVLRSGGTCVAVTNGGGHTRSLWALVEESVRRTTPDWTLLTYCDHAFSLENGEAQLRLAFDDVERVRPELIGPAVIRDAAVAADYVASVGDHFQPETARPWTTVVDDVRCAVQQLIDDEGTFVVPADVGAFVCR